MHWFSKLTVLWLCGASTLAVAQERVGVGADFYMDRSRLGAEQWVNEFRQDEGFDYTSASVFSGSAWLLFRASERVRLGPGLRVYGNYGSGGNNGFDFGLLTEAFFTTEYGLRAFERFELVLGARVGLSVLFPLGGSAFGEEIDRMQSQGVFVFSGPRLGWLGGLSAGLRRKMIDWLYLRVDQAGQYGQLFLFATDQGVEGFRVQKWWNAHSWRFGATLGVEVAL